MVVGCLSPSSKVIKICEEQTDTCNLCIHLFTALVGSRATEKRRYHESGFNSI